MISGLWGRLSLLNRAISKHFRTAKLRFGAGFLHHYGFSQMIRLGGGREFPKRGVTKRDKIRPLLRPSMTPAYAEQGRLIFHKSPEMSVLKITEGPQRNSFLWIRIPLESPAQNAPEGA